MQLFELALDCGCICSALMASSISYAMLHLGLLSDARGWLRFATSHITFMHLSNCLPKQ